MALSIRTRTELFFNSRLKREPAGVAFAAGRLILLGEHLDHQGGPVLAMSLARGIAVAYAVRPDTRVSIWALNAKAKDLFVSDQLFPTGRRWSDLVKGACARVAAHGHRVPGLDLVIFGDLPTNQGLASSAAYLTAVLKALYAVTEIETTPQSMAQDVAAIEREWAGVACGLVDPYVAGVGTPGAITRVDCAAMTHTSHALPANVRLEAEETGVKRALASTPYNERRRTLAAALVLIQQQQPTLTRLPELDVAQFEALAPTLPQPQRARARHVVTETARVVAATLALDAGDMDTVGALMAAGHASLRDDFESSLPKIDTQVAALTQQDDVYGARLQGAGWGGQIAVLRRVDG